MSAGARPALDRGQPLRLPGPLLAGQGGAPSLRARQRLEHQYGEYHERVARHDDAEKKIASINRDLRGYDRRVETARKQNKSEGDASASAKEQKLVAQRRALRKHLIPRHELGVARRFIETADRNRVEQGRRGKRLMPSSGLDFPCERQARPGANGGVKAVAVEASAVASRDRGAMAPGCIGVAVPLALGAVLRQEPLSVRVGGQVGRVDGDVFPKLWKRAGPLIVCRNTGGCFPVRYLVR